MNLVRCKLNTDSFARVSNANFNDGSILDVTKVYPSQTTAAAAPGMNEEEISHVQVVIRERKRVVRVYWPSGGLRAELSIDKKGIDYAS